MSGAYVSLDHLITTPVDTALGRIFGDRRIGGSSGPDGWSSWSTFLACPHKWHRCYSKNAPERSSSALDTGAIFHLLLAGRYALESQHAIDPADLRDRLLAERVSGEAVAEAYRLWLAYQARYEDDYLDPLAVEERVEGSGLSARYDLVAHISQNPSGVAEGAWIVEHKTASRADKATLEGWKNDGQVLGQMLLWRQARLARKWGQLRGVCVNLVIKTATPQFYRIFVPVEEHKLRQHASDLKVWRAWRNLCAATGTWPRGRAACVGRYGLCHLFDECAGA